jgi:hypothetical protein
MRLDDQYESDRLIAAYVALLDQDRSGAER